MSKDFFHELVKRTGLSEELLRRVLQEVKTMTIDSLVDAGSTEVSVPGIATFYCNRNFVPDLINGGEKVKLVVRSKPSTAISRGLDKAVANIDESNKVDDLTDLLKYSPMAGNAIFGSKIRTEQIEALR